MKLEDKAIFPTKGSRFAARHDMNALTDSMVPAKGETVVETGIAIGLQEGTYGRLAARSGMASKIRIAVGGGGIMWITPEKSRLYSDIMAKRIACSKQGIG